MSGWRTALRATPTPGQLPRAQDGRATASAHRAHRGSIGPTELTGADGRFSLGAARAAAYEVACSTDSLGSASASVEVGAGGATVELRLTAAPARR